MHKKGFKKRATVKKTGYVISSFIRPSGAK